MALPPVSSAADGTKADMYTTAMLDQWHTFTSVAIEQYIDPLGQKHHFPSWENYIGCRLDHDQAGDWS